MATRMCCGICHVPLEDNDMVFVDELNKIVHQRCYSLEKCFFIVDVGNFKAVMEAYPPPRSEYRKFNRDL